jgi:hypothetical protein
MPSEKRNGFRLNLGCGLPDSALPGMWPSSDIPPLRAYPLETQSEAHVFHVGTESKA